MNEKLQEAVALYKKGDKAQAMKLLAEIVRQEPNNSVAWYGLALCVDESDKKIYCLKKVLNLDPTHKKAQQLLEKLQPAQPTEREIIGFQELPAQNDQQAVERFQGERSKGINSPQNQPSDKQSSFQLKYLSTIAGIGVMIGTVFTWTVDQSPARGIFNSYPGWTEPMGLFTLIVGILIIVLSFSAKTNSSKASSPITSILAVATLLAVFVWTLRTPNCDLGSFFGDPNAVCYNDTQGFGYSLSMLALFLAFIFGWIPNPKNQVSD